MTRKEKTQRKLTGVALSTLLKFVDKNPQENILKLLNIAERFVGNIFPKKNLEAMKKVVKSGKGVYYDFAMNLLNDLDRGVLKKMILAMGLGAGVNGTKAVRANRDKYKCNIPFLILTARTRV